MGVTVVTTCTDRKRIGMAEGPRAATLPAGSQEDLGKAWLDAVAACTEKRRARDLYCGRSFREAEEAAAAADGKLLVISAGMGLLDADAEIPHYDLTLTRGSADEIASRCKGTFDPGAWWTQVNRGATHPIARRMRESPNDIFVVCLSKSYARLVEQDLLSLGPAERERLRLVGPALDKHVAVGLAPCVLPYDARLDGKGSRHAGTLSDFASRAARHFVTEVFARLPDAGTHDHAREVEAALSAWTAPARTSRTSMADGDIVDAIVSSLPDVGRNSGRMLRHLRDELAIACEQKRFSSLYKVAIERAPR
jgi:hypothetical protein